MSDENQNDQAPEEATGFLKPRWVRITGLCVVALCMSIFAWSTMLTQFPHTQQGDGGSFHKTIEAARVSVARYRELPLWNPYECGGIPLWDNPQDPAAAPLLWPVLFTGTTVEMYFWYIIHGAFGFVSMWLFARHELKSTRLAAFLGASIWGFCGVVQQHSSGGHVAFVAFVYFPLAFLLWRRAEKDVRYAVGLGLLIAWMFLEGAVYPLPHLALFMAAEALTRAWPKERFLGSLRAGGVAFVVGVVVGAVRFLPVIAQLRAHDRDLGAETDALTWENFRDMFLVRHHEWGAHGQQYVWPEFGAYLGPLVLLMALCGLVLAQLEYAWLYALLGLALLLMFGHFHPAAPWSILKGHIFPFKEMRVPSRFRYEVSLFVAMFATIGLDKLGALLKRRLRDPARAAAIATVVAGMAFVGVGDMVSVSLTWIETRFTNAPETHPAPSTRLYLEGPGLAPFIDQPQQNRGRLGCWDEWGFHQGAPLWAGDVPQARAADDGAVVEVGNRTQNTFSIDVDVKRPSRIRVNSAYDHGWRTDHGTLSENEHQLVLDLTETGRYRIKLRYWPHYMTLGWLLTVFGSLATALFFYATYGVTTRAEAFARLRQLLRDKKA